MNTTARIFQHWAARGVAADLARSLWLDFVIVVYGDLAEKGTANLRRVCTLKVRRRSRYLLSVEPSKAIRRALK